MAGTPLNRLRGALRPPYGSATNAMIVLDNRRCFVYKGFG